MFVIIASISSTKYIFSYNFRKSQGLSGRTLRKLPFLAHALFVQVSFQKQVNIIRIFLPIKLYLTGISSRTDLAIYIKVTAVALTSS